MEKPVIVLIAICLSLLTVIADSLIKKAAGSPFGLADNRFIFSLIIYIFSAIGWFYVLKYLKLSTAGTVYVLSTLLFIVFASVVFFKESISKAEILGILFAFCSIFLLYRFG